jgi:hypothetical protein
MAFDFASMQVGDERQLPIETADGKWDEVRPFYDECLAYTKSAAHRPQFQFDEVKGGNRNRSRWTVRRIR